MTPSSDDLSARRPAARLAQALLQVVLPDYLAGPGGARAPAPAVVRALATALVQLDDPEVRAGIIDALQALAGEHSLDEAWAVWAETRQPDLRRLLEGAGRPASYPPALYVLSRLALGQEEDLAGSQSAEIEPLLQAAQDEDEQIAQRASRALRQLRDPQAIDELCRWVIERDQPEARQAALEAGYAPRNPQRRALFFLLTGQWERYEQLDFDARLLHTVYKSGDQALRTRIASLARKEGWAGFVEAVAGDHRRSLDALSEVEWEVILTFLSRERRWEEVWRLAQSAPALWSARLLQGLESAGWHPGESSEQAVFQGLAQAAARALQAGTPQAALLRSQGLLEGHTRLVTTLAISPDGAYLATASADKSVRLWSLPDGVPLAALEGHTGFVLSLAFSPDSMLLASGGADKAVRVWRLPAAGQPWLTLGGHAGEIGALVFCPLAAPSPTPGSEPDWLLVSGDASGGRVWRLPDGKLLHILKGNAAITSLATAPGIYPEGTLLVSGDEQHNVQWWRLPEGIPVSELMENAAAWALFPGSQHLASASPYGRVRVWGLPGGELLHTLEGRSDGRLLAASPDGRYLASSERSLERSMVRVWRFDESALPEGLSPLLELTGATRALTALAFSPDGSLLAAGSEDHTLRLWQLPTGTPLLAGSDGQRGPIRKLAFRPQGDLLLGTEEERVHLWAVEDLSRLFRTSPARLTLPELAAGQERVERAGELPAERAWLAFTRDLVQWKRRFDVEIGEVDQHLLVGELDIEIE